MCNALESKRIFQHDSIPEYNLNYAQSIEQALNISQVGVNFCECIECGFLFNQSYKQLSYDVDYDANRSYSKFFEKYLFDIAKNLIKTFNLARRKVFLEIGFGDAHFLKILRQLLGNDNEYVGYDNSYKGHQSIENIKLSNESYQNGLVCNPDMVIIRHTLEHISNVQKFLSNILWEEPDMVFIEVPCKSFVYNNNYHYFQMNTVHILMNIQLKFCYLN